MRSREAENVHDGFFLRGTVRRLPAVKAFIPADRRRRQWRPSDYDQRADVRADRAAAADTLAANFAPSAFIRIDQTGQVSAIVPSVEIGQGVYTSMPMLIAEELELDPSHIRVEHAPPDDKLYANPKLGFQATGGSTSIAAFYEPFRQAGAAARTMLVGAAAATWGVDASTCRAENGIVGS